MWLKLITFNVKIVITIKPELMEYSRNLRNLLWSIMIIITDNV